MPQVLELDSLTKDFPGVRALDGVSLFLERGQVHALCGENGAGKSTLLKILAGCHPHGSYGGLIRMEGEELRFSSPRQAEERGIALIAQELALVPELSIAENIYLGREPRLGWRVNFEAMRQGATEALAQIGVDLDPEEMVGRLSVGQRQMVEIAKALSKKASVLILDEPTAALNEADALKLLALVRKLAAKGTACLYVSHRLEEVFQIADWITVLRDGRSVGSAGAAGWDRHKVVSSMVGREINELYPELGRPSNAAVLEIKDWRVESPSRPGRWALKDVSLELKAGEVLGLAGLMGAGRTALLASLFGASRSPVQGALKLGGEPWRGPFADPGQAIASGVCLASEDRKRDGLVAVASLAENLSLATLRSGRRHGLLDWEFLSAKAARQAEALGIRAASMQTPVGTLSGGNQQKVVLGKWLLAGPRVLLLDEPTRGIDVGARAEIYMLIRRLAEDGLGLILASSDLPELLGLSHRILVLAQGRPTAAFERRDFDPQAIMHAATS